jgi:deoxyribodipyrimidine photo-lyase
MDSAKRKNHSMAATALVWLRNDLRVADNPALAAGLKHGRVVAVHIEAADKTLRRRGGASRWWLHGSLEALAADLAAIGVHLVAAEGDSQETVFETARAHGADALFWNRRYGPAEREIDAAIKLRGRNEGLKVESFPGSVLVEPFDIAAGSGGPYSVFTPFWKTLRTRDIAAPLPEPIAANPIKPGAVDTTYSAPRWVSKLASHWQPGERAALIRLHDFLENRLAGYADERDFPARSVTSQLSPYLAFGEISPRQIWHSAQSVAHSRPEATAAVEKFLSELAWRDFNYTQYFHRIDIANVPMQERFSRLAWREDSSALTAWTQGRTGFPIVDAGMRELWATGTMHNRVRMLVASLVCKNLLLDWRLGEQWFWDTLVDADPASNPGNWQWVAGSGLDASPFFRIFNPVIQGERFDAEGGYVRRWVPELALLPDEWLHKPFEAPPAVLRAAGVQLGTSYPRPIVDLKMSRERALDALKQL